MFYSDLKPDWSVFNYINLNLEIFLFTFTCFYNEQTLYISPVPYNNKCICLNKHFFRFILPFWKIY